MSAEIKSTENNVVSLEKPSSLDHLLKPNADSALVKLCRDTVTRQLRQTMQQFFDGVDDSLFSLADKSETGEDKEDYLHAMREVREARSEIENRFSSHFLGQYDRFWNPALDDEQAVESELSLLEEDDLDASLAMSNMIAKGEHRFQGSLYELEQRFTEMRGEDAPVTTDFNPLAPKALCGSFQYAAERLELDGDSRMIVFKLFDTEVLSAAGDLYDDVNGLLIQSGILPHISSTRIRKSKSGSDSRPRSGAADSDSSPESVNEPQIDMNLFSSLQQLLTAVRPAGLGEGVAGGDAVGGGVPVQFVQPQSVLTALNTLQQTVVAAPVGQVPVNAEEFKLQLRNQIQEVRDGGQSIGQAEEDTIDVVGMLFEFILEDNNLPDCVRVLIARLQIPILKIGIADKTFFSHKSHPARKLLNELAKAGLGWDEKSGSGLYAQINQTVNRVLNEFADDNSILGLILEEFQAFIEAERSKARPTEDSIRQVLQGKEDLVVARRQINSELTSCRKGNVVPVPVARILDEAWSDVLLLIYVRQGDTSPAWSKATGIAQHLVASVQPCGGESAKSSLLQGIPKLLESLRKGMDLISFDQKVRGELFSMLQDCHLACMRGEALVSPESTQSVIIDLDQTANGASSIELPLAGATEEAITEEIEITVSGVAEEDDVKSSISQTDQGIYFSELPGNMLDDIEESQSDTDELEEIVDATNGASCVDVDSEYVSVVDELKIGSWLEFHEDEETVVRAKLAWKSEVNSGYLFVNHKGEKVIELTYNELLAGLSRGTTSIIDDVPLVDRALEFMVTALAKS